MAKKRSSGEGYVKKRKNGSWRGQIMDGYRDDGKRNIVNFSAPTKGEVLSQIRDYWANRDVQTQEPYSDMSFSEWADIWYADYKSQVQASTYGNYKYTLKILKEYFGQKSMREIKALDINRFVDSLFGKGLSRSYITKCRAMMIQIFDAADANEIIQHNPARKSKMIKVISDEISANEAKKDSFSEFEINQLKQYLPDDMIGHSILLLIGTGMRCQELLALTPEDIAADGSLITVSKAVKTVNGQPQLGCTKSKRGTRLIPVPLEYRAHVVYLREHSGKPYIWTSRRNNGLYDIGSFRRRYYRTISKIFGVRRLSPHCCRHTYISSLEKRGVPMEQIARLAGHTRISTTDGYLHTDIETLMNSVSVLNAE